MIDSVFRSLQSAMVCLVVISSSAFAQADESATTSELKNRLKALEESYRADIDDLQFEIELLNERLDTVNSGEVVMRAPNVFNPLISVVGTFISRTDDRAVLNRDGNAIDDSFRVREVEIDLRSVIDPWAEGVVIAAIESDMAGNYDLTIEEGYVVLKRIPFAEWSDGLVRLKVGRFRAAFGHNNKFHTHNLPWATRPLAVQNFLGREGYASEGISAEFQLPAPSQEDSVGLTLQVLSGGGIPIDPTGTASNYASVGHLGWFREWTKEQTMELGLSARGGASDRTLLGADFIYFWKPFEGGQWRSFLFGGEYFFNDSDAPDLNRSRGGYLWAQKQLSRTIYLGVRHDNVEAIADRSLDTSRTGVWLSSYTSAFFRIRVGVEHTESDIGALDGLDSGFLEISFVFGAHPTEPYWVNR